MRGRQTLWNLIKLAFLALPMMFAYSEESGSTATSSETLKEQFSKANRNANENSTVTVVTLRNLGGSSGESVPITFGQIFKPGDVPHGISVQVVKASGATLLTQVDIKARHDDGSLRHAVISFVAPRWDGVESVKLVKVSEGTRTERVALPKKIDADVVFDVDGVRYSAVLRDAISTSGSRDWLVGPVVTERMFIAPLKDSTGKPHPHLVVRGNVRVYRSGEKRLEIVAENGWAYAPNPRDYRYDVRVALDGKSVYEKLNLTHYHLSRWRKVFWWQDEPTIVVGQDPRYLIESRAVPAYDLRVRIAQKLFDSYAKQLSTPRFDLMGSGVAAMGMATTGGRPEIGPLPAWAAAHVITQHPAAWNMTLAMGNLSGSWPIHFRDQKTELPISLQDFPFMTLLGNKADTFNKKTQQFEAFPSCDGRCKSPFFPDSAHQPSFAYYPYLLTGDYFYLEELQFWASRNLLETAPAYRLFAEGLLKPGQVRAQAWSLRTLAQAAYISPDAHPLKNYYVSRLKNNLAWYNNNFPNKQAANRLGVLTSGYAIVADNGLGILPWQDDFFTWAVGYVWSLGFDDALPLLKWKAKFPVGRMIDPGYCWIFGSEYTLKVRAAKQSEALFATLGEVFQATLGNRINSKGVRLGDLPCDGAEMADWRTTARNDANPGSPRAKIGEMVGYPYSPEGFPALMQPALAVAVDAQVPGANAAWKQFSSQSVRADFQSEPQFAIVPRELLD